MKYDVRLTEKLAIIAKTLGDGNFSAGVRRALESAAATKTGIKLKEQTR